MFADKFDFAERQGCGRHDIVDARLRNGFFASGWSAGAGHGRLSLNPNAQQRCYSQSIQPCAHVVENDAPSFRKAFELANGEGLRNVEEAKKNECDQGMLPVGRAAQERNPLAGHLVDYDEPGVVTALSRAAMVAAGTPKAMEMVIAAISTKRITCGEGCSTQGKRSPKQNGGYRSPGAGTRLAEPGAEKSGDDPGPRSLLCERRLFRRRRDYSSSEPLLCPPASPPRSSRTSGSRMGELIL